MRVSTRLGLSLAIVVLPLFATREAGAKEGFVTDIMNELNLGYVLPCRVCHIQGTTGPGTVQTPFGVSMLAHGLTGSGTTVVPALHGLGTDGVDSDGDGVHDVDELVANTDPNTAAAVRLAPGDPSYGCAVGPGRPGRRNALAGALELLGLAAAFAVARRRAAGR